MKDYEYSYTVLKYRHDAVAGEMMNVGVALYCRETGQVGIRYDHRYRRLSQAFAHFDGESYKRLLERLESALGNLATRLTGNLFEIESREQYDDISGLVRVAWPDQGLSYFMGPVSGGVTTDLDQELSALFDRFVLSQSDPRASKERFDDQQLWDKFKGVLTPRGIVEKLRPVTLGPAEVEFEHAYKNKRWHVIEALSLDYMDGSGMKRRAYEVAGKAAAVREVEEMGTYYVLLGKPRRTDSEKHFASALRILAEAPGNLQVIDEGEADSFAQRLEKEMREHGVLG